MEDLDEEIGFQSETIPFTLNSPPTRGGLRIGVTSRTGGASPSLSVPGDWANNPVSTVSNSLLESWVAEQSQRFDKLQRQLEQIPSLSDTSLDDLADKLEDIDFHTAALSNILDLVVSAANSLDELEDIRCQDEISYHGIELESLQLKRWPLLHALWFHMMMITDPDSIYYSPRIGRDVWPTSF